MDSAVAAQRLFLDGQGGKDGQPNLFVVTPDELPMVKRNENNKLVISAGSVCLQLNLVRVDSFFMNFSAK